MTTANSSSTSFTNTSTSTTTTTTTTTSACTNTECCSTSSTTTQLSLPYTSDDDSQQLVYVILFYKYHTLSNDIILMKQYQTILYNLCRNLQLHGRILIGTGSNSSSSTGSSSNNSTTSTNNNEGINGTLAGQYHDILTFTHALLYYRIDDIPEMERKHCYHPSCNESNNEEENIHQLQSQIRRIDAMNEFWMQSAQFFNTIQPSSSTFSSALSELRMTSPDDFKWSRVTTSDLSNAASRSNMNCDTHTNTNAEFEIPSLLSSPSSLLFPDLHIKLVSELIGTGCPEFKQIPIEETSIGYLTPQEWHEHLTAIYQTSTTTTTTTNQESLENSSTSDTNVISNDAIIIDCRNTKEYQIGHFQDAIHPNMTTFAQFVPWVQRNRILLQQKPKIYMYCTGGIRCEKASAYIRRTVPNVQQVYHLKGGIHKYLEQYGTDAANNTTESLHSNKIGNDDSTEVHSTTPSLWKGRNFVFDGRGSIMSSSIVKPTMAVDRSDINSTTTTRNDQDNNCDSNKIINTNIVGQCAYCESPYDQFDPHCVCTVCREPILICRRCQTEVSRTSMDHTLNDKKNIAMSTNIHEYHCCNHRHLQYCYFTNLQMFTIGELQQQLQELTRHIATIAIGRRYKQKRKTIQKQMIRIKERIDELQNVVSCTKTNGHCLNVLEQQSSQIPCRNCGTTDCIDGRCWGFYGLKRKELLEHNNTNDPGQQQQEQQNESNDINCVKSPNDSGNKILSPLLSQQKQSGQSRNNKRRNEAAHDEMLQLNVALPPNKYRADSTGVRVPPCCTRIVQCTMKAKWYGQSLLKVIQSEFTELAKPDVLNVVVSLGLLRLNGKSISLNELPSLSLKGSDTLGRIMHWHEPPVLVPMKIDVERCFVPPVMLTAYGADSDDTGTIFICNKPSSVPTHPAGPYLFNTLTMMVEGQEGLPFQSLYPLHRTDRVTSGLTLCTTSLAVSRAFQKSLTTGNVDKMYLAKVKGNFVSTLEEVSQLKSIWKYDVGFCEWSDEGKYVLIDAPIYTSDPAAGIRSINSLGKPSLSYFQHLYYDKDSHTSVILCCPITGRNHQLRVHLQAIGFPILNDIQYGGRADGRLFQSCDENAAIDAMMRVRENTSNNKECRISSLTENDVASAKRACKCCRTIGKDGIISSFTKAQLLIEGHSICLHAYRYRIRILPPKSMKLAKTDVMNEIDFQVQPPTWADEKHLHNISWLTAN